MVKVINKCKIDDVFKVELLWESGWSEWVVVNAETFFKEDYI